jgi:hypothetical protein
LLTGDPDLDDTLSACDGARIPLPRYPGFYDWPPRMHQVCARAEADWSLRLGMPK